MPREITSVTETLFSGLIRSSWIPVFGPEKSVTRFGGESALMAPGTEWPMHSDGGPMSLAFQADTDTLPAPIRDRFGGAGMIFQLFLPLGEDAHGYPRHFDLEGSDPAFPFGVREIPKSGALEERTQPGPGGAVSASVQYIPSWEERLDTPFRHGGPYSAGVEAAITRWNEETRRAIDAEGDAADARFISRSDLADGWDIDESLTEWGPKIGGWPALEQGPQRIAWNDEIIDIPETWDHVLQISGSIQDMPEDDEIGYHAAFDGHGWLCRTPKGNWIWYSVT